MKKFNLMIAAGLLASVSMQAQTTIASVGFESGDQKYTTDMALTPGLGTFGDWVNVKDGDQWTEQYDADKVSGEYAFHAENSSESGFSWDRGFKIGNLPIKGNTPYRVSFWIKADETCLADDGTEKNTCLTSWLSQGIENYDKSFCSPSGANYGVEMTKGLTGEWQHISFVSYYTNSEVLNNIIANQSWVGNAVYPEAFGGDGTQTYADYFGGKLPEKYFVVVNMYSPATYTLDDLKVEEGVTFNEATFYEDVIKLDFGYPTNIAALANANNGSFSLDPSCVSVTADGVAVPVEFLEGKSDGYLYIFLEGQTLAPSADVKVSFTPAADCPIIYPTDRRPSSDIESEMKVLGFTAEKAYPVEVIDALPSSWSPAKMLYSVPENDSFEIVGATFKNIALTYDKEVALDYASATLIKNGFETDLTSAMSLSDDKKTINIAVSNLADGEYTLIVSGVTNTQGVECEGDQEISFAVGEDTEGGTSEVVYSTNETFAATANGTFPVGWVANDNGTIHQYGLTEQGEVWNYNWGGNVGGGGTRAMSGYSGDLNGAAIYWRSMNGENALGTLTFGEQVKDYTLADGTIDPEMPEGISLKLDARKYQITIRMCAWKNLNGNTDAISEDNAPKYSFTLEDLSGNVYARFDDVPAMPNVNGNQNMAVTNVTRSQTDFTVEQAGYYMLKFSTTQPNGEYLLGGVDLITMPSKAAYYKQQLAEAVTAAEAVMETAKADEYDGDTKTAFSAAINNAKTGHFTSPSEVNAIIAELQALGEKMTTRVNNIDDFSIALIEAAASYEALAEKYITSQVAIDAKKVIDQYSEVNPSTLSDEALNEVTPLLKETANKLANLEANASLLTWGITKAVQTYNTIGTNDSAALNAAVAAADDDRAVANNINVANQFRVLQILANELVDGQIPDAYLTKVNEREEIDEFDEPTGNTIYDLAGIELTGCVQNPKFYRQLDVDGIPGWTLEAGSDSTNLNIGYGGDAPSAEKPVTDQFINIYGNADYNLSQTLKNLPAGIYTIKFSTRTPIVDRTEEFGKIFYYNAQNEAGEWDKYIYAGSAVTPYKGGTWGYGNDENNTYIENVEVGADGTLLIGAREHYVSGKAEKHEDNTPQTFWTGTTMCDDVRIFLVAPLAGYDYAKAVQDMETGIEAVAENGARAAKVAGIYSVSGAKVSQLQKGINIVRLSDGTVRKVLVK